MAELIQVTNHGNRRINVSPDGNVGYWFRTYYSAGQVDGWFLDIYNDDEQPIVVGIPIVVGATNLIKGYGDSFPDGSQLVAVNTDGDPNLPDSLGEGLYLIWFNAGETNPYQLNDLLLAAEATDWTFSDTSSGGDHNTLTNRFIPNQHSINAIQGLQEELDDKATQAQLEQKIGDAPADGNQYARKNASWVKVIGGGGGTGPTFHTLDPQTGVLYLDATTSYEENDYFIMSGTSLLVKESF